METQATTSGGRAELVTELRRAAVGWDHFGKTTLSAEARAGADEIEAGATSVRVGHVEYLVTE